MWAVLLKPPKEDEMIKTIDKVFGELTFSTAWKRSYDVIFFDKLYKILLIVEENDDRKTIREEQRDSYIYYSQNKVIIEKKNRRNIDILHKRIFI